MGKVMIRCPKTGKAISTGMHIDRAAFGSMPVFFSSTFCPSCRTRTSGLPRMHGSAIPAPRTVTRIARGGSHNRDIPTSCIDYAK